MATYTIIGGDGKEYGSVTADDLRKWIAEGRLNAQSLAKAQGEAAFRPLSAFPEFADIFQAGTSGAIAPVAPPSSQSSGEREAALQAVKGPAIALIIVASLGVAYYGFSGLFTLFTGGMIFHQELPPDIPPPMRALIEGMQGPMAAVISLVVTAVNGFVLFGAIKLLRLQILGWWWLPSSSRCCPANVAVCWACRFGIWALIVLNKPEVKSHFG